MWIAAGLMAMTAFGTYMLKPTDQIRTKASDFDLESTVPKVFGEWKHDALLMGAPVVNPETKAILDKLYSQIVTRTYVNSAGQKVMLSIAYGSDQRGALQAHKPEICYPAQGFLLKEISSEVLETPIGNLEVTRLITSKANRFEPVTYWFTFGDERPKTAFERRKIELKSVLTGQIPDGLLFRVSTLDRDSKVGFATQDRFVDQLLSALPPASRRRLAGNTVL
jgi:EpsI family protein